MSLTFLYILTGYFLIVGSIFTTLYSTADPRYFNVTVAIRTLFDSMMSNLTMTGLRNFLISHSLLTGLHQLLTTLLLLSFFIAGLGKMYKQGMTTTGEYAFLSTVYEYIHKQ